jgi:hypothetical protein
MLAMLELHSFPILAVNGKLDISDPTDAPLLERPSGKNLDHNRGSWLTIGNRKFKSGARIGLSEVAASCRR